MTNAGKVLVLGATGGIGGEVASQLRDAGWEVRALTRRADKPVEQKHGITWLRGDALCREDVAAAARGCSVIVHAVNPPGYRRWSELVLPMLDNTIAAASTEQATGVAQVSKAMDAVDQVAQRNASSAEELSSTAEEMSSQAEALQQLVSFFQVSEDVGPGPSQPDSAHRTPPKRIGPRIATISRAVANGT